MLFTARNYINADWIGDKSGTMFTVIDPANGKEIGLAAAGSADLADQAVNAARDAFEKGGWADNPRLRADVLMQFADQLEQRKEELTELLVRENGKVWAQAAHEISAGVSEARYYAGLARNIFGRTAETAPGNLSLLTKEPAGVVSVIVPWNAPVTLLVRSVAPALAAGCTIVIKPAPQTPLINSRLVECFDAIHNLPAGVVNSVNENGIEVGQVLSQHPEIDVITFTGSTQTGKIVMANAAQTVKRVSLELGGKSPAVVFADADLEKVVAEICRSSIILTGQMCTAISRVLVHESIAMPLRDMLKAAYENVRLGHGLEPRSMMGPLIDRSSQKRVLKVIEQAGDEAELILRGHAPTGDLADGAFVTPTLFQISNSAHDLVQKEHFGPIVSLETFSTTKDAIEKANATRFGLAASVYTRELDRALAVSRKLKFGSVWLNCHNRLMAEAETGGYKESGNGRLHGIEALNDFLETKHIYMEPRLPEN